MMVGGKKIEPFRWRLLEDRGKKDAIRGGDKAKKKVTCVYFLKKALVNGKNPGASIACLKKKKRTGKNEGNSIRGGPKLSSGKDSTTEAETGTPCLKKGIFLPRERRGLSRSKTRGGPIFAQTLITPRKKKKRKFPLPKNKGKGGLNVSNCHLRKISSSLKTRCNYRVSPQNSRSSGR